MRKLPFVLSMLTLLFLAACSGNNAENNDRGQTTGAVFEQIAPFESVNEQNETVTRDDLLGTWWVANFIFTNCETTCPPMTANMKILQDKLVDASVEDVQLISFSVDPERDTPDALIEYSEEHEADLSNWSFLTGYNFDEIEELSIKSFKNPVAPPGEDTDQVSHGTYFFLVNPDGIVENFYSGLQVDDMDEIVEDLTSLK